MSQVWSSGGYLFTFDDDGVNAHTLDGVLVSGITTGFTPWLVEDTVSVPPVPPVLEVVIVPSVGVVCPVVTVPGVEVPEPRMLIAIGVLIILILILWKGDKTDGSV
jgi:hypothetical protein